jgi:hypothetical protein
MKVHAEHRDPRVHGAFVVGLLIAMGSAIAPGGVEACDGPDPGAVEDRFGRADFVAVVQVTSLWIAPENPSIVEGDAEVLEMLKGRRVARLPVRGYSPSVDCWAPVDVGREYLVFVQDSPRGKVASFSIFSPNLPLRAVPPTLLRIWRAGSEEASLKPRR